MKIYEKFKQGDLVFGLAKPRDKVTAELEKKGFTNTYANSLNNPAVSLVMNGTSRREAAKQLGGPQFKHFRFLRRHKDYLHREPGRPVPTMQNNPKDGAAYRRACKLLLTTRIPDRTYAAHVITTGIEWTRVCDKEKSKLGVTDSEMRAAFRDELRYGKNPNIFFYDENLNLLSVSPWEQPQKKPMFDQYREYVTSKDERRKRSRLEVDKDRTYAKHRSLR